MNVVSSLRAVAIAAAESAFMLASVTAAADLIRLAKEKPGELAFSSADIGTPNHLAGELLGVMSDDSGLRGYEVIAWNAFIAPAGTPREIVTRVNADIARILAMPDVKERLDADGWTIWVLTPEEFGKFIRAEIAKWSKVVRESGARAE